MSANGKEENENESKNEEYEALADSKLVYIGNKNAKGYGWGKIVIDEQLLRKLYLGEKKTLQEIANELGVSRTCVRNNLYRCGIPIIEQWQRHFYGTFKDLDEEQKQILLGTLLGDANISLGGEGSKYHQLRLCQKQREYLEWKVAFLSDFFKSKPYKRDQGSVTYNINSVSHPIFSNLYDIFYACGRKVVRREALNPLNDLGLAVWFMDDGFIYGGNKRKGWKGHLGLSTAGFTKEENELIVKWFKEKYGLEPKSYFRKDGYIELHFYGDDSRKLKTIIAPYILPIFSYKLDIAKTRSEAKKEWWRFQKSTYYSCTKAIA